MGNNNLNSLASQVQVLMATRADFPQRLKQRLVHEINKMENHFQFIGGLISKGVLCDGSTDSEAGFGVKEIAQLAILIVCTKGADKIGGLMESLEESGNPQLVSALRTWMKENFGIETDCNLRQGSLEVRGNPCLPSGLRTYLAKSALRQFQENILALYDPTTKNSVQQMRSAVEFSGTKLIDKVISNVDSEVIEQLQGHLCDKAPMIVNSLDFRFSLARQNVVDESDVELKSGPELQEGPSTERAIKVACSKKAIVSLVKALQSSNNEHIIQETLEWLEASPVKIKNYPISVKSLANQQSKHESKVVTSTFFDQAALPDGLSKLATFQCPQKSATKGISALQFDKERMIACAADGTLHMWNWRDKKEDSVQIADQVKNITCFQYGEEILVLGAGQGTVLLFDATSYELKSAVSLSDGQVISLKFIESTLVVFTREGKHEELWWVDISRPDMRLQNFRDLDSWMSREDQIPGVCMYPDISFVYHNDHVFVYDTKSGNHMPGDNERRYFVAPYCISTMTAGDLFSTKRVLVAGCTGGSIGVWNTSKPTRNGDPVKTLRGHEKDIVSLCTVSGHLLSLDEAGKLLMWFGYNLMSSHWYTSAIPIVLAENFSNVSILAAHERWLASGSSEDGTFNIWTLPDLWLHAL